MNKIKEDNIYFITEQEGEVEKEFKEALCSIFNQHARPVRAYLAQVKYSKTDRNFNVALCLQVKDIEDQQLLQQAIKIFKSIFGGNEHLDIIFLSHQQELKLREICCPFFTGSEYQFTIPDFYLISSEGYHLDNPIACFKRKRLYGKHPDGYLLCDINPPLLGENYGIALSHVRQIVLASRHQDYSLFPIKVWPTYVHLAVPSKNFLENCNYFINETDIKLIAWGELYQHEVNALKDNE